MICSFSAWNGAVVEAQRVQLKRCSTMAAIFTHFKSDIIIIIRNNVIIWRAFCEEAQKASDRDHATGHKRLWGGADHEEEGEEGNNHHDESWIFSFFSSYYALAWWASLIIICLYFKLPSSSIELSISIWARKCALCAGWIDWCSAYTQAGSRPCLWQL